MNISEQCVGWSYHKVTFNSSKAKISVNVNFFDQFHEAKLKHLSSEPATGWKNSYHNFQEIGKKKFTFAQIFTFYELKVILW